MTWASPVLQIWTVFQHRLISSRQLCLTCVFLLFEVIYSFWIIGVLNSFCSTNQQVSRDYAVKRKGTHIYSTVTFPVTVVPLLGFARGWVRWRKKERRKCKKVKPFLCLYSAKQWKYHFSFKWTWIFAVLSHVSVIAGHTVEGCVWIWWALNQELPVLSCSAVVIDRI